MRLTLKLTVQECAMLAEYGIGKPVGQESIKSEVCRAIGYYTLTFTPKEREETLVVVSLDMKTRNWFCTVKELGDCRRWGRDEEQSKLGEVVADKITIQIGKRRIEQIKRRIEQMKRAEDTRRWKKESKLPKVSL